MSVLISSDPVEMAESYVFFSLLHISATYAGLAFVGIVAHSRQGLEYWYLVPIFIMLYAPYLAVVRLYSLFKGCWVAFTAKKPVQRPVFRVIVNENQSA